MNKAEKMTARADALREWLEREHPECSQEQRHLIDGSPERAYWHHGYLMALRDVLNLEAPN